MFGKAKWGEKEETERKQKAQIQAWIREVNEQRSVRKQQDKMEWMTRDLLKAIVEERNTARERKR